MPLITRVFRDGQPLQLRWGGFHVAAMILASAMDSGRGAFTDTRPEAIVPGWEPGDGILLTRETITPITIGIISYLSRSPMNDTGMYTLKAEYAFKDDADGEEFILLPGDELAAYRS